MKTEEEIQGYEQREEDEHEHHRGRGAPPPLCRRSGRDRHETLHGLTSRPVFVSAPHPSQSLASHFTRSGSPNTK
ncbi:hypothetical protein B296_00026444 [Ensete ventricosum]|uniref:Uncharacterized protein n=1 Tax=Ensete ventricosum TaxID=4639 RepID=A0A426ZLQ5_ENSVE|nr:hypothetical protein B296_00026444 [Ensete ventricosum]